MSALTVKMLGKMIVGQASLKNLSGPVTIADYAGQSVRLGLAYYLGFLAVVSVSLGVLNLLPLPVLDGGHLMYYLFEAVTGRQVSELWLDRLQRGGVAIMLDDDVPGALQRHGPPAGSPMTDCMHLHARSPARPLRRSLHRSRFAPSAVALALALHVGAARAVEPFVLKDIRVEGLQRSDAGTVFAALPFRIGDTYTDEKGAAALRALFATGLFKDVRIDIDNGVAVVIVDERPVIANIDFVGMKEFEKDALIKSLKDFGIGEGLPFDKALADRAEQELKRQYLTRSLYGAEVVTTVTPQERNRVNVTFTVTEGSAGARSARSGSSATRRSRKAR